MSRHQPECDCGAAWGARHAAGCSALAQQTPPTNSPTDRIVTAANEYHQGRQNFTRELADLGVDIDD